MARDQIPDELRRFILTSIPSVPFVEAVLLFMTQAGLSLDASLVARRLYMPEPNAAQLIRQLAGAGIVEPDGAAWRLAPQSKELDRLLHLLAAYYSSHLIEVTDLIHSRSARQAQQFAEAFRVRKEKE